jgi:D-alanyl-D-alanine carboxypeptidase (penicillin-binding protein 5/6)
MFEMMKAPTTRRVIPLLLGAVCLLNAGALRAQAAVMAVDLYNKKIHLVAGADVKRPVGGLCMIATSLVVLDWADATKVPLGTMAVVPPIAEQIGGSSILGLRAGDEVSLRDLIYASMMASDNVAATTLAAFVGQDILGRRGKRGDPVGEFVSQMNKLAVREGATKTRFTNPHGLENSRNVPYSTAADMARITLYSLSRAPFKFYTNQKTRDITVMRAGQRLGVTLRNTNLMLGSGTIDGVKTGNTPRSGGCAIISEEHPGTVMKQQDGQDVVYRHRMVVVVLGSSDPFVEAGNVLRQGWSVYESWLRAGRPVTDARELLPTYK